MSDWTYAAADGVLLIHDAKTEQILSAKPGGTCTLKTQRPLTRKEAAALASVIATFLKVMGSEVSGDGCA